MPLTLTALPSLKLRGDQPRNPSRRRTSYPRRLALGQFPANESISLFPEINLRIPVGKVLAALAILALGLLLVSRFSQIGALLSGFVYNPNNASISGDPVITGMMDWLPIALVCLAVVVLASLVINRAQYRRELQHAGPRLVTRQQPTPARNANRPVAIPARAAEIESVSTSNLFLIQRAPRESEDRQEAQHIAQEQFRLERDARASALARATEAARLVVSGKVRLHESEVLVVPKPRRPLAPMPTPAAPQSGVFYTTATAAPKKVAAINAPRHHLSRAPHTPTAIL